MQPSIGPRGAQQAEARAQEEAKRRQITEMRDMQMQNLLSAGAREKYNNIKLVKPEKAHNICNTILQMAQRGEIKGKVSPQRFDSILNSVGGGSKINITIARKKYSSDDNGFDSDEDYLNDL